MQRSYGTSALLLVHFSLKRYFKKWSVDTQCNRRDPTAKSTSNAVWCLCDAQHPSLKEELEPHLSTKQVLYYFYGAFYTTVYNYTVFSQVSFKNAHCFNICEVTFLKKIKGKGFRFEQSTKQVDNKGPLMEELIQYEHFSLVSRSPTILF